MVSQKRQVFEVGLATGKPHGFLFDGFEQYKSSGNLGCPLARLCLCVLDSFALFGHVFVCLFMAWRVFVLFVSLLVCPCVCLQGCVFVRLAFV